jgi:hypothetical protein
MTSLTGTYSWPFRRPWKNAKAGLGNGHNFSTSWLPRTCRQNPSRTLCARNANLMRCWKMRRLRARPVYSSSIMMAVAAPGRAERQDESLRGRRVVKAYLFTVKSV